MHAHMMMGGDMIVLFEMSRAHDCTTFHFDAAVRPSPRALALFSGRTERFLSTQISVAASPPSSGSNSSWLKQSLTASQP